MRPLRILIQEISAITVMLITCKKYFRGGLDTVLVLIVVY